MSHFPFLLGLLLELLITAQLSDVKTGHGLVDFLFFISLDHELNLNGFMFKNLLDRILGGFILYINYSFKKRCSGVSLSSPRHL